MSDGGGDAGVGRRGRAQRLPRWTRQEILVLIEGKRVVERTGRGRGRGRARLGLGGGGGDTAAAAEPTKWAAVAEYCRRHGVDRGPVQCRKRWSNLAGDYKKIREWERGCGAAAAEPSFWAMRNDARKERRLPGFFDREVYDILEGRGGGGSNAATAAAAVCRLDLEEDVEGREREKPVLVLGSGASALFSSSSSDEDDDDNDEAARPHRPVPVAPALAPAPVSVPVSERTTEIPRQESYQQGTSRRTEVDELAENSPIQGRQKRQRSGDEGSGRATTDHLQDKLIQILDRSGRMVAAQLETQNINSQLDREQRKDQAGSLLGVLGKMADALYRIADKL